MKKWYVVDNEQTVLHGEEEEVLRNRPDAVAVDEPPRPYCIRQNGQWVDPPHYYRVLRSKEYPAISDQLDAILKYLTTRSDLTPDLYDLIGVWSSIKQKYPKS